MKSCLIIDRLTCLSLKTIPARIDSIMAGVPPSSFSSILPVYACVSLVTNLTVPPPTLSGTEFLNIHFLAINRPRTPITQQYNKQTDMTRWLCVKRMCSNNWVLWTHIRWVVSYHCFFRIEITTHALHVFYSIRL